MQEFSIRDGKKIKKPFSGFGPDQPVASQIVGSPAWFGNQFRPGTFPMKLWREGKGLAQPGCASWPQGSTTAPGTGWFAGSDERVNVFPTNSEANAAFLPCCNSNVSPLPAARMYRIPPLSLRSWHAFSSIWVSQCLTLMFPLRVRQRLLLPLKEFSTNSTVWQGVTGSEDQRQEHKSNNLQPRNHLPPPY